MSVENVLDKQLKVLNQIRCCLSEQDSNITATEAKQNTIISELQNIKSELENTSTVAVTSVAQNASNVLILAANSTRKKAIIFNNSTATLYLKFGSSASTTDFSFKLFPDALWSETDFDGEIYGIWASAGGGNAKVTDMG